MKNVIIRLANETDADAILKIYEPYIRETAITFEYEIPDKNEFKQRIRNIASEYPYIVCVCDDKIVGYAYAHRHMERAAYQWNAELSVYIDGSRLRGGIGKVLYSALIDILTLQNVRNVYGCVTSPNENSERLHEHMGFSKLGVYHNAGYKCGRWHDVAWFEKQIADYVTDPAPFAGIDCLDKEAIMEILNCYGSILSARL